MNGNLEIRKVAIVGDFLPRKCGIATFTSDMHASIASVFPGAECFVVPVNDRIEGYDYPPEVRFEIEEQDLDSYLRAADFLNFSNADVVCLQHEYGIFGGQAGSHVLGLLRELRMPIVTTLHTILAEPDSSHRRIMGELCGLSSRVVTMTERGRRMLREIYRVPDPKIDLIAHGIPDIPFVDPNFYKDQFGVEGKIVVLTFGLLSPNKGIEHALRALPKVVAEYPNLVYVVLGATHPNLVREQGESYRLGLERLARDLGVADHVSFYNRFVGLAELTEFIGAADLYVTPYLNPAQITSGTLAYSFGCGKAVVSTPYWHAEELLADGRGELVPFADPDAIASAILGLLRDDPRRHAIRKRAYLMGREMVWSQSAQAYMRTFQAARRGRATSASPARPPGARALGGLPSDLPSWRLDHLLRLTDSTGLIQHAIVTIPNHHEGYATDDNARALLLAVTLENQGLGAPIASAATRYAAFLNYAIEPSSGRFRNFLGYDRRWLEAVGSDDSQGRSLWALGVCVGRSKRPDLQLWAAQLFERALPPILEMTSPRAWAFALLGLDAYFRRLTGDRRASQARDTLTARLLDLHDRTASADWPWFEAVISYDNARIAEALIVAGRWSNNPRAVEVGLNALRWLVGVQTSPAGHFRAIGTDGWFRKGQDLTRFDQQPLEASATVSACLSAYRATEDPAWLDDARVAFEWFLGRNDLGQPLYDPSTGGCRDGLHPDRTNENQGAESTLAFLMALAEMKQVRGDFAAFQGSAEDGPAAVEGASSGRTPQVLMHHNGPTAESRN